jgi:hypothetical protein
MVVYAVLIALLEGTGPQASTLCRLTRWLGLKGENETSQKLCWGSTACSRASRPAKGEVQRLSP